MSEQKKNNIQFSTSMLEQYARGELSDAERHAIEKAALEDAFLADAIEGLEKQVKTDPSFSFSDDVQALKNQLQQRRNRAMPAWWQAAAAVLIIGVAGVAGYFLLRQTQTAKPSNIAVQEEPKKNADSSSKNDVTTAADSSTPSPSTPETIIKKPPSRSFQKKDLAGAVNAPVEKEIVQPSPKADAISEADKTGAPVTAGTAPGLKIKEAATEQQDIKGYVTDSAGAPVSGATVKIRHQETTTDQRGYYSLIVKRGDTLAQVSAVGYKSRRAAVGFADTTQNRIALQPASEALNEVVVTAYGVSRKRYTTEANESMRPAPAVPDSLRNKTGYPAIGWKSFQIYLDQNKRGSAVDSSLHGKEMISFLVSADGRLSDFRIEESISDGHDAEIERLVKAGPSWIITKGKKQRVVVTVRY